jgi:hypothetical protein
MTFPTYTPDEAKFVHACKTGDMVAVAMTYGLNHISSHALDGGLHMAVKYDHPQVASWIYDTIQDGMNFFVTCVESVAQ